MLTTTQENNLAAFSAHICGLTCSIFMLLGLYIFVPANRFSTWILRCNLVLLFSSLVDFALGIYLFRYALINDLSLSLGTKPPMGHLAVIAILIFIASSTVRTFSEIVLLLRVQAVFPRKRSWHLMGSLLIITRLALELSGKLTRAFSPSYSASTSKALVYAAIGIECLNNLLFTGLFLSRLSIKANLKSTRKKIQVLRIIAVENALFPTLSSGLAVVMTLLNIYPNGWNVILLLSYVVGIPAASVWTSLLSNEGEGESIKGNLTALPSSSSPPSNKQQPSDSTAFRQSDEFIRPFQSVDLSEEPFIATKSSWSPNIPLHSIN